jgi:hypothetical protein
MVGPPKDAASETAKVLKEGFANANVRAPLIVRARFFFMRGDNRRVRRVI